MRNTLPARWADVLVALYVVAAGALFYIWLCLAAGGYDASAAEFEAAGRCVYVCVAALCLISLPLRMPRWLARKDDIPENEQTEGSNT